MRISVRLQFLEKRRAVDWSIINGKNQTKKISGKSGNQVNDDSWKLPLSPNGGFPTFPFS
jgi:hypothetical protein